MRRIIFPARKFHRRNPTRSTDGFLSPSLPRRGPLRRRYLPRRNGSQEFHANGNDQETVRDRLAAIVGRWKMLFPAHRRLVEQSTPFGYRPYLLFSPGKNRFSDLVYGVSRLKIWFILSGGRGRIVFGRFYFELVLEEKLLCIDVCDGDIYMERDDTRCYINLRKRRRERSVSSISRLIRNFGLHFSTLVSMSRRLRKTRGNVVRVMQRKWICRANIHFHFRKEIRKSLVSNRTIFSNFERRESTYIYAYKSRWIIPEPLESDDLGRCGEEFTKFLVARAHSPLPIVLR